MADDSVKAIGELWQTVRAAHRAGLLPAPDPAMVKALGPIREALKKSGSLCRFFLDERKEKGYTHSRMRGKGERPMQDFIAYYRVSTKAQGASGLGLEAQKKAVQDFAARNGARLVKEFLEVESGKKADRPELAAALAFAKRAGGVLVVAKLDRLARNVHFLSGLMQAGVDFLAVDNPHANKLTVHVMAAMAEYEREAISARTKAALAQVKERGGLLGSARPGHWEGHEEARRRGGEKGRARARKAITQKARAEYRDILPMVKEMREKGMSLRAIAAALNAQGHKTRRGKAFLASTIQGILERGE
jgi:DNA invertase Pin-like site-specific DNA recombinase